MAKATGVNKNMRERYKAVIDRRIRARIQELSAEIKRRGDLEASFLKSRGILEEYRELKSLWVREKELKQIISNVLGTCSSVEYTISEQVKSLIGEDTRIVALQARFSQIEDRVTLANTLAELDAILAETECLGEEAGDAHD